MIRVLMSITLFWFCTLPPTFAQGLSLPPGITSESAAQGWIALFDGETTFGWNAQGPVQINDGCLIIGGELPASLSTTTHFLANDMELEFCSVSDKHSFKLKFGNTHSNHDGKGNSTGWDTVKFQNRTISSPAPYVISTEPGTVIKIRSCIIKPVGARSIFNGKDLTGWKEFPGRKSRYSVTSRGELNVLDGAGDLQTLEEFDDFLLQLDIISNGDHLNSGIF
ncbi:MAG TPA: DUF1080 domain-containing protein, partial [Gemmatales bacterium]|nr:DUF1080 domain-containing protein [Gemmatales bacterium]